MKYRLMCLAMATVLPAILIVSVIKDREVKNKSEKENVHIKKALSKSALVFSDYPFYNTSDFE